MPWDWSLGQNLLRVAVHLRRGDVSLQAYEARFTPNSYYTTVMQAIQSVYRFAPIHFMLLSEGEPAHFQDIVSAVPGSVTLNLNGHALLAFHAMVDADVLVTAVSSLSYSAGLLSSGLVLAQPVPQMPPLGTWLSYRSNERNNASPIWSTQEELSGLLCKKPLLPLQWGAACNCSATPPVCI